MPSLGLFTDYWLCRAGTLQQVVLISEGRRGQNLTNFQTQGFRRNDFNSVTAFAGKRRRTNLAWATRSTGTGPWLFADDLFRAIRLDFQKLILPMADMGVHLAGPDGRDEPEIKR
jgi:hypothetical protein